MHIYRACRLRRKGRAAIVGFPEGATSGNVGDMKWSAARIVNRYGLRRALRRQTHRSERKGSRVNRLERFV